MTKVFSIRQQGFTLVELAIVLVIIGVLMGGFIGTLSSRIDKTRIANTEDDLESNKEVLMGYAYTVGTPASAPYVPCPDCLDAASCPGGTARDGVQDRNGNLCSVGNSVGLLPWVTLGISGGDEWGTRYHYWVDPQFGTNNAFDLTTTPAIGQMLERTANGAATQPLASNIVAVILSQGKNGYGGISTSGAIFQNIPVGNLDEIDNANNDNDFVSRTHTTSDATTAGGEFDDILVWISEYELKAKMVEAGALP